MPKIFQLMMVFSVFTSVFLVDASSIKSAGELDFNSLKQKAAKEQQQSRAQQQAAVGSLPDFYPFGAEVGDVTLPQDDDGFSAAVDIPSGLPTYSSVQRRAFVNTNGMISFTNGINEYKPRLFPINGTEWLMLAIFWTDVDVSPPNSGTVYYRAVLPSGDKFILDQLTAEIRIYFPQMVHFEAQFALIATWVNVAPYRAHSYGIADDARNTFQASLVTDGRHSFVIYRYQAVEWSYQLSTKLTYAQAGVNSGDGRWAAVDGSGTSAFAMAATRRSNVGRPGVWAFRVDNSPVLLAECRPLRASRRPQSTASLRIFPPWIHFSGDTTVQLSAPCLDLATIQRADCQLADLYNGTTLTPKIAAVFNSAVEGSNGQLSCQLPPIPSFNTNMTTSGRDQSVMLRLVAIDLNGKEWSFVGTLNVLMTVQHPERKFQISGLDRFVWSGLDEVRLRWDASASVAQLQGAKPKLRFEALVFTGTVRDGRLLSTEAEVFPLDDSVLGRVSNNENHRGSNSGGQYYTLKGEQTVRLDLLEARIWERIPQQSPALLMATSGEVDNSVYFLDGETIVSGTSRVTSKIPLGVILRLVDSSSAGGSTVALTTGLGVYRSFAEHPVFVCVDWINREMARQARQSSDDGQQMFAFANNNNSTAIGCPPLERQAAADFRFQADSICRSGSVSSQFCADFRPFKCYEPVESRGFVCCYSSGRLCANCGTSVFASPTSRLLEHIFSDVFPTMSCCPASSAAGSTLSSADALSKAALCQTTFKQVRPSPDINGTLYRAPRLAAFYGDPHLQTLDGFSYTYNGAGLFQLLETIPRKRNSANRDVDGDDNGGDDEDVYLSIQGLFEPLGDGTVIQALSIYDGQTVVDVFVRESNSVVVYVNGTFLSPFATTSDTSMSNPNKQDQIEIIQSMPGSTGPAFVSARRTENFRVFIETVNSTALSALVFLDERHLSQTRGLLGVWNRRMDDDLTLPNNTVLPLNSSAAVIHHVFGESWSLPANMSHFRVLRRRSLYNNPKNKDFRPLFADSPEMLEAAQQNSVAAAKCDADLQCLFDLLATGRQDVAKSTLNFRRRINELQHDLRLDMCPFTVDQLVVISAPSGDIYTTPCPHGTTFAGLSPNEFCRITAEEQLSQLRKRAAEDNVEGAAGDESSGMSMAIVQLPVCRSQSPGGGFGPAGTNGVLVVDSALHVAMYAILVCLCAVLLALLVCFTSRQRMARCWIRTCSLYTNARRTTRSVVVRVIDDVGASLRLGHSNGLAKKRAASPVSSSAGDGSSGADHVSETGSSRASTSKATNSDDAEQRKHLLVAVDEHQPTSAIIASQQPCLSSLSSPDTAMATMTAPSIVSPSSADDVDTATGSHSSSSGSSSPRRFVFLRGHNQHNHHRVQIPLTGSGIDHEGHPHAPTSNNNQTDSPSS